MVFLPGARRIDDDRVRFSVALRNVSDRTIIFPPVQTPDTDFARQIFAEANPTVGARHVSATRIFVAARLTHKLKSTYIAMTQPIAGDAG